jgi:hypothetical protein
MRQLNLAFLWFFCATIIAILLTAYFHACSPPRQVWTPPPMAIPAKSLAAPKPGMAAAPQSYTYVGNQPQADSAGETGEGMGPAPAKRQPQRTMDSSLALGRTAFAEAASGAIPDLDLRFNSAILPEIIRRYGYVPAVKSRDRLLGKISGDEFAPLAPGELAQYSRRGRAGGSHPEAERWLARVAVALSLPRDELQFIFLVPHKSEARFIAAEQLALERSGRTPGEVALVRGHFDEALDIVVDELVTKSGVTIAVDSVRLSAKRNDLP